MTDEFPFAFPIGVLVGVVGTVLGIALAGGLATDDLWHREAVATGHAEFYIDTNFDRAWRWKTNCVQKEEGRARNAANLSNQLNSLPVDTVSRHTVSRHTVSVNE